MKEQQIWIKTMDSAAEVGNLILIGGTGAVRRSQNWIELKK